MMLNLVLVASLLALVSVSAARTVPLASREGEVRTTCSINRGNLKNDAESAIAGVLRQIINQAPIEQGRCIYTISLSTAASVCADTANGFITSAEVEAGFGSIMQQCGSKDNYNGAYHTSDFTFSLYGVNWGIKTTQSSISKREQYWSTEPIDPGTGSGGGLDGYGREPQSSVPLGEVSETPVPQEMCLNFQFSGISRYDCPKKQCYEGKDPNPSCVEYCEVRRTGFLGPETEAPPPYGQARPPGQELQMQSGVETSVSNTVGVSLGATVLEAISLGINYEYSTGTASTRSFAVTVEGSEEYFTRWVYFPRLIETCGDIYQQSNVSPLAVFGVFECEGPIEKTINVCSLGPWLVGGEAQVEWVQRFEDRDGNAVSMDKQSTSYKATCSMKQDPDGDGQNECLAPPVKEDPGIQTDLKNLPAPVAKPGAMGP